MFKFLTGKEIGHLQTGLILSQIGGLLIVFTGLLLLLPSSSITVNGGPPILVLIGAGLIKILAPIMVGRGSKIAFWVVIFLSVLKLLECFVAIIGNNPQFIWYLPVTGSIEIGVLIHMLSPKGRAELNALDNKEAYDIFTPYEPR
ncbi:hypothetical protein M1N48_00605 [Dehalococcoidia bacterium]|nr:hypothetical protein [Dehalococcoidia bacterium]MCL0047546.1 hypothetical protein [Dehalococcoidia bacterium]